MIPKKLLVILLADASISMSLEKSKWFDTKKRKNTVTEVAVRAFFYKQNFHKQHQAQIGKKLSKS